jgi:hypothetical protein
MAKVAAVSMATGCKEGEWKMKYRHENRSTLFSAVFSETLWETLITLGVAAAICIGLTGLSAHLNAARALPPAVAHSTAQAAFHQH